MTKLLLDIGQQEAFYGIVIFLEPPYARYVGLGILGHNLHVLGKLLIAQDDATCQAAKSKRKKQAG